MSFTVSKKSGVLSRTPYITKIYKINYRLILRMFHRNV